jgi:enterobacterial common antigen flippase
MVMSYWSSRKNFRTDAGMASLARPYVATLGTNVLIVAAGIVTGVLAARVLLPEGRGLLAAVLFWPQLIAGIGIFSLNEAITLRVAQGRLREESFLSSAMTLLFVFAAVAVVVGYFALPSLLGPERSEWAQTAQVYLALFVPLNFVALVLLSIDQAQLRFTAFNALRLVVPAIYLVVLVVLWIAGQLSVESAIWANLAATLLATMIRLSMASDLRMHTPSLSEIKSLLTCAAAFQSTTLVAALTMQMDQAFVISFLANEQVGLYAVALTVAASGLSMIGLAFHSLLFPHIATRTNLEEKKALLGKGIRYSMLASCLAGMVLAVLSPWLITGLFGASFGAATEIAVFLLAAHTPLVVRQVAVRCLRGLAKPYPGTISELVALGLFGILVWPLNSSYGLIGVTVALFVSQAVALSYIFYYLSRELAMAPGEWWGLNCATVRELIALGQRTIALRK